MSSIFRDVDVCCLLALLGACASAQKPALEAPVAGAAESPAEGRWSGDPWGVELRLAGGAVTHLSRNPNPGAPVALPMGGAQETPSPARGLMELEWADSGGAWRIACGDLRGLREGLSQAAGDNALLTELECSLSDGVESWALTLRAEGSGPAAGRLTRSATAGAGRGAEDPLAFEVLEVDLPTLHPRGRRAGTWRIEGEAGPVAAVALAGDGALWLSQEIEVQRPLVATAATLLLWDDPRSAGR